MEHYGRLNNSISLSEPHTFHFSHERWLISMLAVYFPLPGYVGFAVRSRASRSHLPLLSLQYTQYYIRDGIIRKTSSIDFWTKTQQPINLSPIFARHWHHISICFKPFHVNQQARSFEFFQSTSPMILGASSKALMVESYLLSLFCFAMVYRWTVRHSTVCPRPLPANSLSSLLPVPSYHDYFSWRISISTFLIFSPLSWINLNDTTKGVQQQTALMFSFYGIFNIRLDNSNWFSEF